MASSSTENESDVAARVAPGVQVYYHSPTDVLGERDVNVDETELVLTNLAKFQQYVFRVVAYNGNGPGPATEELTCRTFSDGNRRSFYWPVARPRGKYGWGSPPTCYFWHLHTTGTLLFVCLAPT